MPRESEVNPMIAIIPRIIHCMFVYGVSSGIFWTEKSRKTKIRCMKLPVKYKILGCLPMSLLKIVNPKTVAVMASAKSTKLIPVDVNSCKNELSKDMQ